MVEPIVLGSVAAGNAPKGVILGSVAAGKKPKTVALGSVAQQQANNSAYASSLAAAATQPAGTAQGTPWITYMIIAAVMIVIGYYLYNRRGGNSR